MTKLEIKHELQKMLRAHRNDLLAEIPDIDRKKEALKEAIKAIEAQMILDVVIDALEDDPEETTYTRDLTLDYLKVTHMDAKLDKNGMFVGIKGKSDGEKP